jgi:Effector-associated domain 7/SIR2-like domain
MNDLDQRQWGQLAQAIRDGKCFVFLGPGATINYGDPLRQGRFFESLARKNPSDILAYHAGDGFLVFKDAKTRSLYEIDIRDFFREKRENPLLERLAQIPFHTAISVTPDMALKETFDKLQFACWDQYYATKVKVPLHETPSAELPLLYNLLGSIKEPQTIISSHADLFGYMQSIFGDKNLPDELSTMFNAERTKSIIFLGFEFDKWYFQLILYILGIKIDSCWRYAVAQSLPTAQNQTLYEAQFEIEFVSNDLLGFVDRLAAQFAPDELRQPLAAQGATTRIHKTRVMQFVIKAFTPAELEVFCMIHFEAVHQEFTTEMSQTKRIGLLMEYAERHGLLRKLLETGRAENPYQYDQCGPYHES